MPHQKILAAAATACAVLSLSACQKNDAPSAASTAASAVAPVAASTAAASAAATAKADIPTLSPAMQFWVDTNRGLVNKIIVHEHPKATEQQKLCLNSTEGWANYVAILKPYTEQVLTPAEIAEADKFYGSGTGLLFATALKQQMGLTDSKMPPVTLNETQRKELALAMQQPFMTKIRASADKMSEKDAETFARSMMNPEIKRCGIQ